MDRGEFYKILLLCFWFAFTSSAQTTSSVKCIDPQFEAEVDRYLDYSVPIISVADAFYYKNQYIFLDAREKEEFEIGHIPEAEYIGYEDFDINNISHISKNEKIIVYCSIGYRSEKIAEKLLDSGYKHVVNLYGSIFEWANQNYPIQNKNGNSHTIHTYNKKWSKWVINKDLSKIW